MTKQITLTEGQTLVVRAVPAAGCTFADDAVAEWTFVYDAPTDGGTGGGTGGSSTTGSLPTTGGDLTTALSALLIASVLLGLGIGAVRLAQRRTQRG